MKRPTQIFSYNFSDRLCSCFDSLDCALLYVNTCSPSLLFLWTFLAKRADPSLSSCSFQSQSVSYDCDQACSVSATVLQWFSLPWRWFHPNLLSLLRSSSSLECFRGFGSSFLASLCTTCLSVWSVSSSLAVSFLVFYSLSTNTGTLTMYLKLSFI